MTLFARRALQRVLDENANSFLTPKQAVNIRQLLNKAHANYLAVEWEQVILNAASKFGDVQHEPRLGSSTPDLLFRSSHAPVEFLAEITAPSDQGFHDLNPVDAFQEEFWRRFRKSNLSIGGFDIQIEGHPQFISQASKERIRVKLARRARWDEDIFNAAFHDFLRKLQTLPEQSHRFDVVSAETGLHISYDPAKRGATAGYPSFTVATVINRNPVYNALKSKGDQLKASKYGGICGVFLCDGGCQMILTHTGWSSFSTDDVIRYFFRQFDSVWFVVVFGISQARSNLSIQGKLHLNSKKLGHDFSQLKPILDGIYKSLPRVQWSPVNARNQVKANDLTGRYYGTLTSGANVKMSARELLEILAGVKTVAQFQENYGLDERSNPFRQMLREGRLISKVTVERRPEEDDDTVTIEFGKPDAAIAPFRILPSD